MHERKNCFRIAPRRRTVSTPLSWEELETAQPLDFTLTNVAERLAQSGDPWRDALARKQSLERTLAASDL